MTLRKWLFRTCGAILAGLLAILFIISPTLSPGGWGNTALLALGTASGVVTWLILRRSVMSRAARLSSDVSRIGASGAFTDRVAMPGGDEVSELARAINGMLKALEYSQRTLQESEERYRAVVEQIVDGLYLLDVETRRVLDSNAAFQSMLGYTREQMPELALYDIVAGDRSSVDAGIERILIEKHLLVSEQKYRRSDGSLVEVWVSTDLISLGGRQALCAIVRDVSLRKRTEAELSTHARQQVAVAELGQRALIGADLDALMNETVTLVARTLDVEHCKLLQLLPDGNAMLVQWGQGGKDGRAESGPLAGEVLPPTGTPGVRLLRVEAPFDEPLQDPGVISGASVVIHGRAEPLGMLGAYTTRQRAFTEDDAHFLQAVANVLAGAIERKRAEEALQESERRYKALFDSASDAILIHDLEGRLLEVNQVACERLGYSREELLDKMPMNLIAPEYAARVLGPAEELRRQGHAMFEATQVQRNGTLIPVEVSSRIIEYAGSQAVLSIARDITERKQARAALEEERALLARRVEERTAELSAVNAELAGAARLKDEFLASMSHELRTPLNTILGMSEALEEQAYGPLNDEQRTSLQIVEESGRHLLDLINDILDLSKIGAGKLELEIGPVPVESICQASLGLVKQIAHKKQLKVLSGFDHAVTTILADGRRLKQILVNLLSNAVKFTPEGGSIGLEVVGDTEQQVVHFTVWDTGIGIRVENMGRLFQPFVQLDSRLAREYAGTGLGLALVYRMVEMHGGGIAVASDPGHGSRFTVSLPWREVETEEAGSPTGRAQDEIASLQLAGQPFSSRMGLPLILLADDNQGNINTLSQYLLAKGYRVIVARNGGEAIARAREERPDLILMDIQMPMIDGLEATRRIRADAQLANIPIIALTALAMPGDRERCLEVGMNDYMSKPVSLKGLVRAIETQIWKGF
jgi:PAS domain S-box-containing protein